MLAICYAVNVWQILHETNQTILKQDKAFLAKEKMNTDNKSYFLPFVNGTPILMDDIFSYTLVAMVDSKTEEVAILISSSSSSPLDSFSLFGWGGV